MFADDTRIQVFFVFLRCCFNKLYLRQVKFPLIHTLDQVFHRFDRRFGRFLFISGILKFNIQLVQTHLNLINFFFYFFLLPLQNYHYFNATGVVRLAILLCFVFSAVLLLRCRCEKGTKLLLCLFLLLLPLAANAIEVIAPESALCTRMTPGLLSVFYLPLLLAGQAQFTRPRLHRLLPAALAAMLLVTSLNYAWQSNGNDISVSYANQKAENYFATMLTRARSLEGYREDMRIVFVGKTIQDAAFYDNWNGSPFGFSARTSADEQINEYSRSAFIVNYLGIYFRDITPEEETRYAEVIAGMETYPNDGSLCIADDLVLIRLE